MVIKGSDHCFLLDDYEVKKHDEFVKKHEKCQCEENAEKFSYYDRPGGFSNWYGLHILCNVCGEDQVIGGEDFWDGPFTDDEDEDDEDEDDEEEINDILHS